MKPAINTKRAYEPAADGDGFRVYVDALWPRGLSHETFRYDFWDKEIAPSTDLRHFFHADPDGNWQEFVKRYTAELEANPALADLEKTIAGKAAVTLLYSSHDHSRNNAVVLKNVLLKHLGA